MSLDPGSQVGAYEILQLLGAGGMASVYEARHTVLGSKHALKVLRSDLVANAGIRQRFLDEGRVQAQLQHPGIVRVTDLVSEPGVAGLVMDLVVGTPLDVELQGGALSVERSVGWMLQVLGAVAYAHDFGIVHRDLKPSNLFIAQHEGGRRTMRVLDFGIAKVDGKARTLVNETIGTYAYMSPEQVKDSSSVDRRSDIFSLGAVLYEMVTGQPAFQGDTDYATLQKVTASRRAPLSAHGANVPPSLESAIGRALEVDPAARFQTCEEFAAVLQPLARREDLALLDDWSGVEAPAPVLLGGEASATWDGTPLEDLLSEVDTMSDAPTELDTMGLLGTMSEPEPDTERAPEPLKALVEFEESGRFTLGPDLPPELPAVREPTAVEPRPLANRTTATVDRPTLPDPVVEPHDPERHEVVVRLAGAAQILAGLLNTFVLWFVMCWGMPWVFTGVLSLIGMPAGLLWLTSFTSLLGCGLLVLGPIEILTGLRAVLAGSDARRAVQRTAVLQIVAIGMGGVPSFLVGLVITGLLLSVRPHPTEGD